VKVVDDLATWAQQCGLPRLFLGLLSIPPRARGTHDGRDHATEGHQSGDNSDDVCRGHRLRYPVARIRRRARRRREVSASGRRLVALRREGPNSRVRKSHHDMAGHPVRSQRHRSGHDISRHLLVDAGVGTLQWGDSSRHEAGIFAGGDSKRM
jgi:hypothetical protein